MPIRLGGHLGLLGIHDGSASKRQQEIVNGKVEMPREVL